MSDRDTGSVTLRAQRVQARSWTLVEDEHGVIRIYIHEDRFTWKVIKPGAGIEVIEFTPTVRRTKPLE